MTKTVLYLLIALTIGYISHAQETGYEIIMDEDYDEFPSVFRRNDAGCFVGIVRKAIYADSTGDYNTFLYKVSPYGDTTSIMFSKVDTIYNFYYLERVNSEPKGFLLSGWGYKVGGSTSNRFAILRRIDEELNLIWEKTYNIDYYFGAARSSTLELNNGNFIYACSPNLNTDMFIMELSPVGDSLNYVFYSGDDAGEVWGLTHNNDSTAIWLTAKWAHYPGGGFLSCVITLNSQLQQVDINYFPEDFFPPCNSLLYNDDLLLIGGSDQFVGVNDTEFMIGAYLLDTAFNVVYDRHLTSTDTISRGGEVQAIDFYYPSCIYLGGTHNLQGLFGNQPSWFYITKLNDTLGVEYEKYIGGDYYYWLNSVTAASDGGVLLAGTYQEFNQGTLNRNALILKLDSTGCLTSKNETTEIKITEAIIYPNPGVNNIFIRTVLKGCIFWLFDLNGKLVCKQSIKDHITSINVKNQPQGNYYYSITSGNKNILSGTWIKN